MRGVRAGGLGCFPMRRAARGWLPEQRGWLPGTLVRTTSRGSAPRKRAERDQPPKQVRQNRTAKETRRAADRPRSLEHHAGQRRSPKRTTPQSRFPARASSQGQSPEQQARRNRTTKETTQTASQTRPLEHQTGQSRSPKRTTPQSRFPARGSGPGQFPKQRTGRGQPPEQQPRSPTRAKDRARAEQSQSPKQATEPNQHPNATPEQRCPRSQQHPLQQHQQHLAVPPARRTSAVRPPRQVGVPRGHGPRGTRPRRTWRPSSCSGGPAGGPRCFPHPGTGRCVPTGYRTSVRSVSRVAAPASPLNPAGGIRARGAGHGCTGVVS